MANYNPPIENLPIFDVNMFKSADSYITQGDADKRYLRYPNAQGTENFAQINVNGTGNFNATTFFNDISTFDDIATFNGITSFNDTSTFNSVVQMKKPLYLNSTTSTDREIQNTTYTMIDKTNNNITGKIYADIGDIFYDNDINGKSHNFYSNSASGVQSIALQMNTNNFIINALNLPTAPLATLPASTDSSNKIPTTAWVQTAITSGGSSSTYTQTFTTSGSIITPTNCRFVDIQVISFGGVCGVSALGPPVYYGGSGSGGNLASIMGAPMESGLTLTFTFVSTSGTGYVEIKYTDASGGLVNVVKVYNGNKGDDGIVGGTAAGGIANSTASVLNSNFGTWLTAIGTNGSSGNNIAPVLTNTSNACPRGTFSWANNKKGVGQRLASDTLQTGLITITFHKA